MPPNADVGLCIIVSHLTMSIDIHDVLHRGIGYDLSLLPDDTLAILGTRLETLTTFSVAR